MNLMVRFASALVLVLGGCGGSQPASQAQVPGRGDVEISETQLRLSTGEAAVTVQRESVELSFSDSGGRTVLRNTRNARPAPFVGLEITDALGSDLLPELLSYAPIVFEVGGAVNPEWPAGFWVGNLITGARAGAVFAALDVEEIEQDGERVHARLSTNDPSGRVVHLTLKPAEQGAVETHIRVEPATGVTAVAASFAMGAEESVHGFGGRHNAIDQRGNELLNYVQAQNLGAGPLQPVVNPLPGTGGDTYLFPSGPTAAFYVQALFVSTAGYGFFLDNDELARWRMGSDRNDAWQVSVSAPELRFLVAPGDVREATRKISAINGRHRTPPNWALGPVLSRSVRALGVGADDAESYEAKVRDDLAQIEALNLPLGGYAFEAWDILPREFTREVIERLHARGLRAYLYVRNYVGRDLAGTEDPRYFDEALANGYAATAPGGLPYFFGTTFLGLGVVIDYTHPPAVQWWRTRLREMLDLGADGFMQDFGENVLSGMQFSDGSSGVTMHNRYLNLYHRTTREVLDEYQAETGREVFFYTRGGYSGRPGSAAHENSNFPGDETTDWARSAGIASLATDMLSRAVGGAWGFNTDIGGYVDIHVPPTSKELFIRWSQWAALSPVFRVHNSVSNGVRMPWNFDEETLDLFRQAAQLHVDATPYILQQWAEGQTHGLPPTRPLWLHFPDDARARREDQQWLLGPDVLVAPVIEEGARTRKVYFPSGCWNSPQDGQSYEGPAEIEVPAPLERLPYFFRCGTKPFEQQPG